MPQQIYLLDASVRENIALGVATEMVDQARLEEAAREAGAMEFIERLPRRFEEQLGNRGVRLSGGQRQRLGIARALYRNPSLLVLDEATSSLDEDSVRSVVAALLRLRGRCTVVVIAHHDAVIAACETAHRIRGWSHRGEPTDRAGSRTPAGRQAGSRGVVKDPAHDPFGEQERAPYRMLVDVLGIRVRVRSNSRRLLRILEQAFGSLPAHRLASRAQQAELTLLLRDGPAPGRITTPAPMRMHSGAGVLLGIMDANNLVSISVEHRRALLCVNRAMLGFPYHLRYELMEFALYTLAPRMQRLLPLHAACVGLDGRGLLLERRQRQRQVDCEPGLRRRRIRAAVGGRGVRRTDVVARYRLRKFPARTRRDGEIRGRRTTTRANSARARHRPPRRRAKVRTRRAHLGPRWRRRALCGWPRSSFCPRGVPRWSAPAAVAPDGGSRGTDTSATVRRIASAMENLLRSDARRCPRIGCCGVRTPLRRRWRCARLLGSRDA